MTDDEAAKRRVEAVARRFGKEIPELCEDMLRGRLSDPESAAIQEIEWDFILVCREAIKGTRFDPERLGLDGLREIWLNLYIALDEGQYSQFGRDFWSYPRSLLEDPPSPFLTAYESAERRARDRCVAEDRPIRVVALNVDRRVVEPYRISDTGEESTFVIPVNEAETLDRALLLGARVSQTVDRATRDRGRAENPSAHQQRLSYRLTLRAAEFDRLKLGLLPASTNHKWFAFFEDRWLHLHRSWTGAWFASVQFAQIESAWTVEEVLAPGDARVGEGDILDRLIRRMAAIESHAAV